MQASHNVSAVFDDPNLVSVAGLVPEALGRLLIVTREKEAIWVKDTDVSGRELCATSSGWLTSPIKDLVSTPKRRAACPRARDA